MTNKKDLANFSWSLVEHIDRNHQKVLSVSTDVEEQRKELCMNCEYFDKEKEICKQCGCFVPQKVKNIFELCPVDKWGKDKEGWLANFDQLCEDVDNAPEYR